MKVELPQSIIDLIADTATVKVIATTDQSGFPHAVGGVQLLTDELGRLLYLEKFESSVTHKNLTRSIWFDGRVAIALSNSAGQSVQIKGIPVKNHITGPVFLKYYLSVSNDEKRENLAAVWEIEPEEVIDENPVIRSHYENEAHPFFTHLDRIAR